MSDDKATDKKKKGLPLVGLGSHRSRRFRRTVERIWRRGRQPIRPNRSSRDV